MNVKYRFNLYPNIICDDNKTLYQLEHFCNKRTHPFKKLTYNKKRKAFRIKSQWVSRNRLLKLKYESEEFIGINLSNLEKVLLDIILTNK